jgi:hypothetical protein
MLKPDEIFILLLVVVCFAAVAILAVRSRRQSSALQREQPASEAGVALSAPVSHGGEELSRPVERRRKRQR